MSSVASLRRRTAIAGIRGVSRYDRAAGLIVSLVILLGLTVGVLLFIWLAGKWSDSSGRAVPVVFHPGEGGDPDSLDSGGLRLEAPTIEEIQREADLPFAGLRESLTLVDQLVRTHSADLAQLDATLQPPTAGGGAAQGFGDTASFGEGGGSGGVVRGERWEIRFTPGITLDEYRRQLDFFKIELAAIAPGGRVEYVRELLRNPPHVERDRAAPEARLFMSWREGSPRSEADRRLVEEAGVQTAGKLLVQFLPAEVETMLAALERNFAGRDARTIRRTAFGVRPRDQGFEFYVVEQIPL